MVLPLRSVMVMPGDRGMLGNMPGYLAEPECFGVKLVSLMPRNKPPLYSSHLGLVLLFEAQHGCPVGCWTRPRSLQFAPPPRADWPRGCWRGRTPVTSRLLGAGEQARTHLEAMRSVRALRRVRVWARDRDKAAHFARIEGERYGMTIEMSATVQEAVAGADIICTLTKAREPMLLGEWLVPGAHLNVVGSSIATAAEIDTPAVAKARFFVDCRESTINEGGEYLRALAAGAITPGHILGEIGEVANGSKVGPPFDLRRDAVQVTRDRPAGSRGRSPRAAKGARRRYRTNHRVLVRKERHGHGRNPHGAPRVGSQMPLPPCSTIFCPI